MCALLKLLKHHGLPVCMLVLGAIPALQAEESVESLVQKLADDQYAVRVDSANKLVEMCRKDPKLIERLAPIAFSEEDEIERVLNVREVIAEAIHVERGAIGITLNRELIVANLVDDGPAKTSGIELGSQLLSVAGKSVEGKSPLEVYALIHATRPGSKLEMEFVDGDGQKVLLYPEIAPRSTIRSDENPEQRKQERFEEWFEKKRKELQPEAD